MGSQSIFTTSPMISNQLCPTNQSGLDTPLVNITSSKLIKGMYVCSPWCSSKYALMYLVYYVAITRVYGKPDCMPMKLSRMLVQTKMHECSSCKQEHTSVVCANKSARALFVETTMHTAVRLMCTREHLTYIFMSSIFRAHAGYFAYIFRNVSSHVVASHVCSQV